VLVALRTFGKRCRRGHAKRCSINNAPQRRTTARGDGSNVATKRKVSIASLRRNVEDGTELARLVAEQHADALLDQKNKNLPRRKHLSYDETYDHRIRGRIGGGASAMLHGEELRAHVRWFADRELTRARCVLPPAIDENAARARARHVVEQRASQLHHALSTALEDARTHVALHKPRDGGAALSELAAVMSVLEPMLPELSLASALSGTCASASPEANTVKGCRTVSHVN